MGSGVPRSEERSRCFCLLPDLLPGFNPSPPRSILISQPPGPTYLVRKWLAIRRDEATHRRRCWMRLLAATTARNGAGGGSAILDPRVIESDWESCETMDRPRSSLYYSLLLAVLFCREKWKRHDDVSQLRAHWLAAWFGTSARDVTQDTRHTGRRRIQRPTPDTPSVSPPPTVSWIPRSRRAVRKIPSWTPHLLGWIITEIIDLEKPLFYY